MSGKKIGIIAEDVGDVEVLKILASKLTTRKFATSHFVGKGCGPIKKKIPGWCKAFLTKKVTAVVVVHDRDKLDPCDLRAKLEGMLPKNDFSHSYVVIPSEELEAWLLCDENAIKVALNLASKPAVISTPEAINSPKEFLGEVIRNSSKNRSKQYVNTVHNKLIAHSLKISNLSRCPSFTDFRDFISEAIG